MYPLIYFINWVMVLTGPFYYPIAYFYYCISLLAYMTFRCILQCISWTHLVVDFHKVINQESAEQKAPLRLNDIYHAVIIPNYKEDSDILSATIANLAKHPAASERYIVFLAMEDRETGSAEKAEKLIQKHKGCFKSMHYTLHVQRPIEHRGKSPNVSWCIEHMEPIFQKLMIPQ